MATISDQLSKSISQGSQRALGGASSTLNSALSKVNQSLAGSLSGALSGAMSQAGNLLSGGPDSLLSSAKALSSKAFGSTGGGAIANRPADIEKGDQSVNSKVTALASDSAEALNKPVAFVTKSVKDIAEGASTIPQGSGVKDIVSNMSDVQKDQLQAATGIVPKDTASVNGAIAQVTNGFGDQLKKGAGSVTAMLGKLPGNIVSSTSRSFTSSLNSSISSTLNKYGSSLTKSNPLANIGLGSLKITALNNLPRQYSSLISRNVTSAVSSIVSGITNGTVNQFSDAFNAFTGFDTNSIVNAVANLGDSSKYPTYKSTTGKNLSHCYGKATAAQAQKLYKTADSIFNKNLGVTCEDGTVVDFKKNKDLFDVSLQMAADNGMNDYISNMKAESDASKQGYFDGRTINLLKDKAVAAAERGDINTYGTIQNVITPSNMKNSKTNLTKLAANANISTTDDSLSKMNTVLSTAKTSAKGLVTEKQIGNISIINSSSVVACCATSNTLMNSTLGKGNTELIQRASLLNA